MSFWKNEDNSWKWHNLISVGLIALVTLLAVVIALAYTPEEETAQAQVITINQTENVVYYNYYTIEGKEANFDVNGCKMVEMSAGGYALVCRK